MRFVVCTGWHRPNNWERVHNLVREADPNAEFGNSVRDAFFSVETSLTREQLEAFETNGVFEVLENQSDQGME